MQHSPQKLWQNRMDILRRGNRPENKNRYDGQTCDKTIDSIKNNSGVRKNTAIFSVLLPDQMYKANAPISQVLPMEQMGALFYAETAFMLLPAAPDSLQSV